MAKETFEKLTHKIDMVLHPHLEQYSSPIAQRLFRPNALTETQDMHGIIIFANCKLLVRHTSRRYVYGTLSLRKSLSYLPYLPEDIKQTKREQKTNVKKSKKKNESYYPQDYQEMEIHARGSRSYVHYKQWSHIIEIDLALFTLSHDKFLLIDFIKIKTQQKCIISASKHVFLIHDIDTIHPHVARALLHCMEKTHEYAFFVFSTTKINYVIQNTLINLCALVKNDFRTLDYLKDVFVDTILQTPNRDDFLKQKKETESCVQTIYAKTHHDLFQSCVLLTLPSGHRFRGYLPVKIENIIAFLYETKPQNVLFSQMIRKTTHELMGASVPFKEVVHHTHAYISRKHPQIIYDVVALSAKMEHDMNLLHKPIYIWENYFHSLLLLLHKFRE